MISQEHILVADDDPAICLLLRETLRDVGYTVSTATNGDELVRLAQEVSPDLLLVDLMMPLMDGFEAIRQLRNDTRTAHLPMIILTARSASIEVVTGFDSGADDYIVKPYDIDVLLARIRSHLRRASQLPVRNPLTGLPGNMLLQAELEHLLSRKQPFSLLYIDLDNFKAFNDAYGFSRGDRAIHMLAEVLSTIAPQDDFLGHIGGDDFAMLHFGTDVEELCKQIIAAFDAQVGQLYDPEDLQRGYLQGIDRQGVVRRFGLLSLSIAVVSTYIRPFSSVDDISKVAAEMKSKVKMTSGSSYEVDRRQEQLSPPYERRGKYQPAALLIHPHQLVRGTLMTALQVRGYRPLVAPDILAAQTLLAHTPQPALLVADVSDEHTIWQLWHSLPTKVPFVALVADSTNVQAVAAEGVDVVLAINNGVGDLTEYVVARLPEAPHGTKLHDGAAVDGQRQDDAADTTILTQSAHQHSVDGSHSPSQDKLTGLWKRDRFDTRAAEMVAEAEEQHTALCVLFVAINDFRQLDEQWTSVVINEALVVVASILLRHSRIGDLVARYNNEEFALLLPHTTLDDGMAIAEQIRRAIDQYDWSHLVGPMQLSLDIGISSRTALGHQALLADALEQLSHARSNK